MSWGILHHPGPDRSLFWSVFFVKGMQIHENTSDFHVGQGCDPPNHWGPREPDLTKMLRSGGKPGNDPTGLSQVGDL